MSSADHTITKKTKMGIAGYILIALILGLATGIFFGERCAVLAPIGDGFIRLLQMTILPYIMVSLIQGIGGLGLDESKRLALRGGAMLLITWAVALIPILLIPLSFPNWESGSFFSSSMVAPKETVDFLDIYIPTNPFYSMANNLIPAVVLFCMLFGVALINNPKKKTLLDTLGVVSEGLTKITGFIVKLTPLGVFALVANAAGTLGVDEIMRIQIYAVSFIVICLFMTYIILPSLVSALTPFSYKQIITVTHSSLITAFTTGNLFVVLPTLIHDAKALFTELNDGVEDEKINAYIDVLVPVSFNFPNAGKLVMLIFIMFAGWFTGSPMEFVEYPGFIISGVLSFFGSVNIAVPFLLDMFNIPADLFQFFVVSGVITGYFATLLAAMSIFCITILGAAAMTGKTDFSLASLIKWSGINALAIVTMILGLSLYFGFAVTNDFEKGKMLAEMNSSLQDNSGMRVLRKIPTLDGLTDTRTLAVRMKEKGTLRVGYFPEALPTSFFNGKDELVGMDIDIANLFAAELGMKLVLIPGSSKKEIATLLKTGMVDIFMGSYPITVAFGQEVIWTLPVMNTSLASIVPDSKVELYSTLESIRAQKKVRLACIATDFARVRMQRALPNVELVQIERMKDFFEDESRQYDGFLGTAEAGSAWTLRYPEYSVVIPAGTSTTVPVAYMLAPQNRELREVLNSWLTVYKGTTQSRLLYDYWILGKGSKKIEPRWCIATNVLKWDL